MAKEIIVNPEVTNLVHGLKEIGYTLDTAVADIVDNSITAGSTKIEIGLIPVNELPELYILDNGSGMSSDELVEAMRIATKNPNEKRESSDLGRYGLGLKTASFSQSNLVIVLSKKVNNEVVVAQWDLHKITKLNEWRLDILSDQEIDINSYYFKKLRSINSGTLVVWNDIYRFEITEIPVNVDLISKHLSMVFNRFLSGKNLKNKVVMTVNNIQLDAFDPLDKLNPVTTIEQKSKLKNKGKDILIQPCILPSGKITDEKTFSRNATPYGYKESQGFYLYRSNRLITWGTWWGIFKRHDNLNLIRIEIDIDNDQDKDWSVSVTKSGFSVKPPQGIRNDLRAIVYSMAKIGKGVLGGRKKLTSKTITPYWELYKNNATSKLSFKLNKEHPLYQELVNNLEPEQLTLLSLFFKEIEKFLPIDEINRKVIHEPKNIDQGADKLDDKDLLMKLYEQLKASGRPIEHIENFFKAEGFEHILKEIND